MGTTRRKKAPTNVTPKVPAASSMRNAPVSPESKLPTKEKKNALRPNAASGNAVAVPLWCGQLSADVFTEPAKAMQPPKPVRKEKKHINETEPDAVSYAARKGKYPIPSSMDPIMTAGRDPLVSTRMPAGTPSEYIPRLPKSPIRLLWVAER